LVNLHAANGEAVGARRNGRSRSSPLGRL
jgi:hypothetical protein